jgi:hypothetical protein
MGEYIKAHQTVLELDWKYLVAGHLDRVGTKADVQHGLEYAQDSVKFVGEALDAVSFADTFAAVPSQYQNNAWVLFNQYQRQLFEICYDKLVAKWGAVLGGVDVYGRSHCEKAWQVVALG